MENLDGWLDTISKRVATIDGVKTAVTRAHRFVEQESVAVDHVGSRRQRVGDDVAEELATTKPRIAVGAGAGGGRAAQAAAPGTTGITITAWQMQPGDDKTVAERVYAVLSRKRPPRTTTMSPPAADVSGRWDVEVEFSSSRSQHALHIEQEGNWIQGRIAAISRPESWSGMIEGDTVTLRSVDQRPGDSITFIFAGTLANGTIWAHPPRRVPDSQVHGEAPRVHDDPRTYSRAERAAAGDVKGRSRARERRLDWSPPSLKAMVRGCAFRMASA